MARRSGLSARAKLTLSYAGFLMIAGALLLTVVWVFLLRRNVTSLLHLDLSYLARIFDPSHFAMVFEPNNFAPVVFAPAAVMVLGFLLVLGLVGGWILAGRMLAPLSRITDATRRAAKGSLAHRIELEGRTDEFRDLADAFDGMLARLEAHVAEQQRFAANASHELRTPLSITQTLLDVARKDPDLDMDELLDRLQVVNMRAIDLTEAMLLLSRADQRSFTREQVDLSLIAEDAVETLLPLAEKRGVTIEAAGDIALVFGSQALLLQMTTNLLHNAVVHNLPERGFVWVSTTLRSGIVTLTVENTGEKLTSGLVSTLTEPFQRGTERIHSDHAGVGLGLAIVQSIVRAHDGNLTITARPDGGLCVAARFPATPPPVPG